MVAQRIPVQRFTAEEYLELERAAEFKSEFFDGTIYSMAGGSPEHNTIGVNASGELHSQLKGRPCQAFTSDMKVRTHPSGLYSYPDVAVVCGTPEYHDEHRDVLVNPRVIIEVLSPSTADYDRGKKWTEYQRIASLTDYLVVYQDEPRVDHHTRKGRGRWLLTVYTGMDASVPLASIVCTLRLADLYDRVEFPPPATEPQPARPPAVTAPPPCPRC